MVRIKFILPRLFFIAAVVAALLYLPAQAPKSWTCSTDTECEDLAARVEAHRGLEAP